MPSEIHLDGFELFENLNELGRGVCLYVHAFWKAEFQNENKYLLRMQYL